MAGFNFRRRQRAQEISSPALIGAQPANKFGMEEGKFVRTNYTSVEVPIPSGFLMNPPAEPISVTHVDFANSPLPEYAGGYAVILDGVLSQEECDTMLALAQKSSGTEDGWKPAMLNAGIGVEVLATDVRNCDRIIWDTQELADRVLARCLHAEGLEKELSAINGLPLLHERQVKRGEKWRLVRPNERLRFLRYGVGHYFKSHCDGTFESPNGERSFYTLHLYLNTLPHKGMDGPPPPVLTKSPPSGGSTTFLPSRYWGDGPVDKGLWVAPRAGRVLIFQHKGLLHDGEEVKSGLKVTMRTDLMYELDNSMDED